MTGSSNLGIGLTMFLRDEFSGPAAKINAAAMGMKKSAQELYEDQLRYTRNLSAGMAMIGATALVGLGRAIKKGAEFQYQMEFTGIVTSATTEQTKQLIKYAQKLSTQYSFSAEQIAAGMKEMGKAGMGVQETMTNISSAIELAISTDTDLAAATDMQIAIMKQWRLGFEESARVANMMSYAVNASVISMPDLAEAMKYAGATAIDTGIHIEEATAMIMALGQAGLKGSMAGVAVENALRYLGRAIGKSGTGQQKQALQELGMTMQDVQDSAGNMRPVVEVFENMGKAINRTFGPGMGIAKQDILTRVFGVRGKRSASLFLRNLDQLKSYTMEVSTKSANFATSTTKIMMDQLASQIKMTGNVWKQVGQNIAKSIAPILNAVLGIIRVIGSVMAFISKSRFLTAGIIGFITIKTAAMAYRAVVAGLKLMHIQLSGSMVTMAGTTVASYRAMAAAATSYKNVAVTNAVAARLAGVGIFSGGKKIPEIIVNKAGRFMRNPAAGKGIGFVSAAAAGAYAARAGSGLGTWAVKSAVGGLFAKGIGMLGGPLGMAIAFVLPGLINSVIGVLRDHRKATDDNTNALDKTKDAMSDVYAGNARVAAIEYIFNNKERLGAMRDIGAIATQKQIIDPDLKRLLQQLIEKMTEPAEQPLEASIFIGDTLVSKEVIRAMVRKPFIKQ